MRKKAAEEEITVEEVITVLVETSFGVTDPAEPHSQYFGKLYGRALSDPSPTVQKVVNQYYDERARGFVELMHLACPSLGETELYWGLHSVFGAMLNIHTDDGRISRVVPLTQDETNLVHGAEPIIRFLAAGFKALADVPKQTLSISPARPGAPPRSRDLDACSPSLRPGVPEDCPIVMPGARKQERGGPRPADAGRHNPARKRRKTRPSCSRMIARLIAAADNPQVIRGCGAA